MDLLDERGLFNEGVLSKDGGLSNEGDLLFWVIKRLTPTTIKTTGMKRYMICSTPFTLNTISERATSSAPHKNRKAESPIHFGNPAV
jgi:hypothetical protein